MTHLKKNFVVVGNVKTSIKKIYLYQGYVTAVFLGGGGSRPGQKTLAPDGSGLGSASSSGFWTHD